MPTRAARRAQQRDLEEQQEDQREQEREQADARQRRRSLLPRLVVFGLIVVVILGAGTYMAASVFLGQRGTSSNGLAVRLSMAGFDPKVINAKAGSTLKLDFWNTDNAMHLDGGGVHTFIMDNPKIYVTIPAEARQGYDLKVPDKPGDYDFYCNTCCGGKESPTMHGTLRVTSA